MNETYPAIYRDKLGEEKTSIHNDGKRLSMTVRGVTFAGSDFDSLEPTIPLDHAQLEQFTLANGDLCACEIECDIPITIVNSRITPSNLHVHLKLGAPRPDGGIENEKLQLRLDFDKQSYHSCGQHGWFEDEVLEIEDALPKNCYMKCCFNCAYSDYFPGGSGHFGTMFCFRDNKKAYLEVENKDDLFQIWDTGTGFVQETYLCPEFEKRVPGTGYRG